MNDKFNSIKDLRDHITAQKHTTEQDKTIMLLITDIAYLFGKEDGITDPKSNFNHTADPSDPDYVEPCLDPSDYRDDEAYNDYIQDEASQLKQ